MFIETPVFYKHFAPTERSGSKILPKINHSIFFLPFVLSFSITYGIILNEMKF